LAGTPDFLLKYLFYRRSSGYSENLVKPVETVEPVTAYYRFSTTFIAGKKLRGDTATYPRFRGRLHNLTANAALAHRLGKNTGLGTGSEYG